MASPSRRSKLTIALCALSLSACALPHAAAPVGRVVVAPQVQCPAPSKLVTETPALPPEYYQRLILDALQMP